MKHFGTVKTFDENQGRGSITPEKGGEDLGIERSAIQWDRKISPTPGQRLSYELNQEGGKTRAVNLETI